MTDAAAPVALTLNGKPHAVPAGTTVAALLVTLGIATPGVAVAVNERVVRAALHGSLELRAGDEVEIVRAVSGG